MSFQNIIEISKQYFPELQVKFKNESLLMKFIGKILFFNKKFMTDYATTIGHTIYFPSQEYINTKPATSTVIFLHELVHINDSKKEGMLLFKIKYLFPQILVLLFFPLLLISWKISLLALIFLGPIPASFRKNYEMRGYKTSLYISKVICDKDGFETPFEEEKQSFIEKFTGSSYYFMWNFKKSIDKELSDAIDKINNNQKPFEDPVFDILDKILEKY